MSESQQRIAKALALKQKDLQNFDKYLFEYLELVAEKNLDNGIDFEELTSRLFLMTVEVQNRRKTMTYTNISETVKKAYTGQIDPVKRFYIFFEMLEEVIFRDYIAEKSEGGFEWIRETKIKALGE